MSIFHDFNHSEYEEEESEDIDWIYPVSPQNLHSTTEHGRSYRRHKPRNRKNNKSHNKSNNRYYHNEDDQKVNFNQYNKQRKYQSKHKPKRKPKQPMTYECLICMETKKIEFQHIIKRCSHTFCRECLRQHILYHSKGKMPCCPRPECDVSFTDHDDLQILLTHSEYHSVHKKMNKIGISKLSNLTHCLTPDCPYAVQLVGGERFDCGLCGQSWCIKCQIPWHSGQFCEDYQAMLRQNELRHRIQQSDIMYMGWVNAQNGGVRKCPQCNNHVEKNGGCNHVTCRCGVDWCWTCRVVIDGNNLNAHFGHNHPVDDRFNYY